MKIVTVASQKGGSGKTTLARTIAVAAVGCRYTVALVDTDPQGSLTDWWNRRDRDAPALIRQDDDLPALLQRLRNAGDGLVIVDTPPSVHGFLQSVIDLSDLVLVPVRPSPDDLAAVKATLRLLQHRSWAFVLTQVKARTRLVQEAEALTRQQATLKKESLRVPAVKLDALVNLVGELVVNQARLSQIATTLESHDLANSVEEANRLAADLRDIVLNIRMMPIGTTFSRFTRLVRDLSSDLGKEVQLITEGAETELDKTVIDRLVDPLVHLIRNCLDHGIEPPAEREAAGKPRRGTIRLVAQHKGDRVVVSVGDDVRGLNRERIYQKGQEKGLVPAGAVLSEAECLGLIFHPGFSTAAAVTDVSGRGVGMDVVKREITALRGTVDIATRPGAGTTISLGLPLTLAIIDGLLVRVACHRYVIPLSVIEECLELAGDHFVLGRSRNVIAFRGRTIPVIRLRDVFEITADPPPWEETVVANVGGEQIGFVVDRVIGNYQTVIKSLGKFYQKVEAISGATILGDGDVALVLDVAGVLRMASEDGGRARRPERPALPF
ncbi:MAG: chemotaxis protein CheW [Rhodospirillaceae bacterium]